MLRYLLCFLCGALVATYTIPPTPRVEVDDTLRRSIAYEVLETLEDNGWDATVAKRELATTKSGWWN